MLNCACVSGVAVAVAAGLSVTVAAGVGVSGGKGVIVAVGVSVTVGVGLGVNVLSGLGVFIGVGVLVAVGVMLLVGEGSKVPVGVFVGDGGMDVFVGVDSCGVLVAVLVGVGGSGVFVGVFVGVGGLGVFVGVFVSVGGIVPWNQGRAWVGVANKASSKIVIKPQQSISLLGLAQKGFDELGMNDTPSGVQMASVKVWLRCERQCKAYLMDCNEMHSGGKASSKCKYKAIISFS